MTPSSFPRSGASNISSAIHGQPQARNPTTPRDLPRDHADELAIEFDIIPLDSVRDEEFAEA